MDKLTAVKLLQSTSAHDRLQGARYLSRSASAEDLGQIDGSLAKENVLWVRNALYLARRRAVGEMSQTAEEGVDSGSEEAGIPSDRQVHEIYSNALHETTSLLLHEIGPLVGKARLYARREIDTFDESKTKKQFDLLDSLLTSISDLRTVSSPPRPVELDLSTLIREIRERESQDSRVEVQLAGPSPFTAIADRGRLLLAIANGLRNALESTASIDIPDRRPVVINWNRTDEDFWVSVIDHGTGLKAGIERIFDIGTTSRRGHLGMGLAIARQAILSMGGDIEISPRDEAGVKFEIRWPRFVTAP